MKCPDFLSSITVEPALFLFSLSHGFYVIIVQSLYIAKVCNVNLNYSREVCDDIYSHKEVQVEVQKYVSVLQAWNSVLQSLPAVAYALFAGPWSDVHGRRTLIIMSCCGYFLNNSVYIINAVWWDELKAEYLLFECLQDCTGGYTCFFLGCYAYISDITPQKSRTRRLAYLDGLFPVGFFVGMAVSGVIKKKFGYVTNFVLGIVGSLIALLYTVFFLKDSRQMRPPEVAQEMERREALARAALKMDGGGGEETNGPPPPVERRNVFVRFFRGVRGFFNLSNLRASFSTVFRSRPDGVRPFLVLLIVVFIMQIFFTMGRGPTYFLYLRKEFSWTEVVFGRYMAVFGMVGLFTQYVAVPFLTSSGCPDAAIGFMAVSGAAVDSFMAAFAKVDWILYIGGLVGFLSHCGTIICRSLMTKCVGPFEVGAVFSVVASFQAIVPVVSAPFFGYLYKATIETFPGAFLLLSALGYVCCAFLFVIIFFGLRKVERRRAEAKTEEKEEEEEKIVLKT